jgi:hypothetical protein
LFGNSFLYLLYQTVLNTLSNQGGQLGAQAALRSVDFLKSHIAVVDAYYLGQALSVFFALVSYPIFLNLVNRMQSYPMKEWRVPSSKNKRSSSRE